MFLRIKPIALSILFGIKEWVAAAACPESDAPCSAPLQTVGRAHPGHKGPPAPKSSSLYLFLAAVSDMGPASVLPPVAAGALNKPGTLLQPPGLPCISSSWLIFALWVPAQRVFELCPNKLLNSRHPLSRGAISQACRQRDSGRGFPGTSPCSRHRPACGQGLPPQQLPQGNDPALTALTVTAPIYFTPP